MEDNTMRMFIDTENGFPITEFALQLEYEKFKHDIEESTGARTFDEMLSNALSKNGFLREIPYDDTLLM
jgi:hypothetical protein